MSELFEKGSVNISNYATLSLWLCYVRVSCFVKTMLSCSIWYCTVLQNGGFEIALLEVFGVSIVLV